MVGVFSRGCWRFLSGEWSDGPESGLVVRRESGLVVRRMVWWSGEWSGGPESGLVVVPVDANSAAHEWRERLHTEWPCLA